MRANRMPNQAKLWINDYRGYLSANDTKQIAILRISKQKKINKRKAYLGGNFPNIYKSGQ